MKIYVEDYLSQEEIADICRQEVRASVRLHLQRDHDFERIFTNSAYQIMFEMIDETFDGDVKEFIKTKTLEILNNRTEFGIFRARDAWGADESVAYAYVQKTVGENLHLIHDKIIAEIQKIPKKNLSPVIKDAILEKLK